MDDPKRFRKYAKQVSFLDRRVYPKDLVDGVGCGHPGCLNHVTHPCECCGRIQGKGVVSGPVL